MRERARPQFVIVLGQGHEGSIIGKCLSRELKPHQPTK